MQQRAREILEVAHPGDRASRLFDVVIISLILLNILCVMLETVEGIYRTAPRFFSAFETISVLIFTAEYFLRVWSCVTSPAFSGSLRGRLRFIMTPLALVDLCAVLPFYISGLGIDLRVVRIFRVLRVFRIAKLGRYSASMQLLTKVVGTRRYELLVTLGVMFFLLLVASCLMYHAETESQPDVFTSIPATMWWGVETLTTVGYGDAVPVTLSGKVIASIMAILGIGVFALPAGILGSAFLEEVQRRPNRRRKCPHCGGDVGRAQ